MRCWVEIYSPQTLRILTIYVCVRSLFNEFVAIRQLASHAATVLPYHYNISISTQSFDMNVNKQRSVLIYSPQIYEFS